MVNQALLPFGFSAARPKFAFAAVGLLFAIVFAPYAAGYEIVGWGGQPPQSIPAASAVKIVAGFNYSLAIKSDGNIIGWGDNWSGQTTPPAGNDFADIAAGYRHGLAIKSDGSIVGWGYNGSSRSTPPAGNDFAAVAAGVSHSLALTSSGSIIGWGGNWAGQATPPEGNDFTAIAAGFNHSLALRSDGSIVVWGWGDAAVPQEGNDFTAIAAGGWHNLALKSDGSIVGWGGNWAGQATPPEGNDFVAIAAGDEYSLALKSDGTIVGWGDNRYGQAAPPQGNDFIAISAGALHSLALRNTHPVAEAGCDQIVYLPINGKANVLLDGSGSSDADGDMLTYKWRWRTGSGFCEANGVNPEIELPSGVHTIELIVNDGYRDSAPDDVNISVIAPLEGKLNISPSAINRRSNERHILAVLRLPDGIGKQDIDEGSPLLLYPGEIKASRRFIIPCSEHGRRFITIIAFFNKGDLMAAVPSNGIKKLKVGGRLKSGRYFFGDDTVIIFDRRLK